jgi:hypothetical protein
MTQRPKRLTNEELNAKMQEDIAESKKIYDAFKDHDMIDEDGYPTEEALQIVESWHWSDAKGWFDFIGSIWYYKDWGWKEKDEPHEWNNHNRDLMVHRYYISTAGWSGNEAIIRAMQKTEMLWYLNWVQSRRGGHYIFELKEFNDDN